VAIPASAVITKADGTYALVLDDSGSYVEQKVQTGISNGQWIEILSGIQAGETVAAFGDTGQ
jgi:multidrug efflux pump subunit AcrA (membrane-fusion protein)